MTARMSRRPSAILPGAALLLLAGCSAEPGADRNPDHRPGYSLDNQSDPDSDHDILAGAGYTRTDSVFQLVNGADVVRVHVADLGGSLVRVATPDDAKVAPTVDVQDNVVVAGLHDAAGPGPAVVSVTLAPDVRWQVRLSGGANDQTVDLSAASEGGDVELIAGTSRAEVSLPPASGTQNVTMSGGASQLMVHVAGSAPVRVQTRSGAGAVTIEGHSQSGVAGGTVFTPADWPTADNRYDINATAGVSTLTVTRG